MPIHVMERPRHAALQYPGEQRNHATQAAQVASIMIISHCGTPFAPFEPLHFPIGFITCHPHPRYPWVVGSTGSGRWCERESVSRRHLFHDALADGVVERGRAGTGEGILHGIKLVPRLLQLLHVCLGEAGEGFVGHRVAEVSCNGRG